MLKKLFLLCAVSALHTHAALGMQAETKQKLSQYMNAIHDTYKNYPQKGVKRPSLILFLDDFRNIFTLQDVFNNKPQIKELIYKLLTLEGYTKKEIDHLFEEANSFARKNFALLQERLKNEEYEALYLPETETGEHDGKPYRSEWRHDIYNQDEQFDAYKTWQEQHPDATYQIWLQTKSSEEKDAKSNARNMEVPHLSEYIWMEKHKALKQEWLKHSGVFKKLYEHIYAMVPASTKSTINDYNLDPKTALPF